MTCLSLTSLEKFSQHYKIVLELDDRESKGVFTSVVASMRPTEALASVKLINKLTKAHDEARHLVSVLNGVRSEEKFKMLFDRAATIAKTINVLPSKPRTTGRQAHRANARAELKNFTGIYVFDHDVNKKSKKIFT